MTKDTPIAGADERAPDPEITLTEFCTDLSVRDRRVEMVAGFFAHATQQGLSKATPDQWGRHFTAFQSAPA